MCETNRQGWSTKKVFAQWCLRSVIFKIFFFNALWWCNLSLHCRVHSPCRRLIQPTGRTKLWQDRWDEKPPAVLGADDGFMKAGLAIPAGNSSSLLWAPKCCRRRNSTNQQKAALWSWAQASPRGSCSGIWFLKRKPFTLHSKVLNIIVSHWVWVKEGKQWYFSLWLFCSSDKGM